MYEVLLQLPVPKRKTGKKERKKGTVQLLECDQFGSRDHYLFIFFIFKFSVQIPMEINTIQDRGRNVLHD